MQASTADRLNSRRRATRDRTRSLGGTRPRRGEKTVSVSGSIYDLYVYAVSAAVSTILFHEMGCPDSRLPSIQDPVIGIF